MVSQVKDQEPRRLSVFSSLKPVVKTWDSWRQTGDFWRRGIPGDMGFLKSHWLSVHNRNLSNWLHICQGIGCSCGVTKCGAKRQGQAIKNQIISILPCIFLRWGITGRGYLCLGWVFPYQKKIDACIGKPNVDNSSIETHCLDSMLLKVAFETNYHMNCDFPESIPLLFHNLILCYIAVQKKLVPLITRLASPTLF